MGGQLGGGVAFEVAGVFGADGEDDLGAGVRGDPLPQVGGELGEVLVGHGDRQPVGAGLGEHVFQRVGQVEEVLALVDVQAGVGPGGARGCGRGGRRPARCAATMNEPTSWAVSSPRMPLGSRARHSPPWSRTPVMSKVDGPAAMACAGEAAEQERAELVHQRADGVRAGGQRTAARTSPRTRAAPGRVTPAVRRRR